MRVKRTAMDWFRAAEGWSLPASGIGVLCILAWTVNRFGWCLDWVNAALSLVVMLFFQAGSSALSDCCDHVSGVDRPDDPKVTWIYSGLIPLRTVKRLAGGLLVVGMAAGVVILIRTGWEVVWLGVAGVILGVGYSFFKYRALGDLAILLAFALLPALGIPRVVVGTYRPEALLAVLPVGLITLSIVHANNLRDIESDRAAGIRTLAMLLGKRGATVLYVLETLVPYLLVGIFVASGFLPCQALAVLLALPFAVRNARHDPQGLDRLSALHQLFFGSVYALSLILKIHPLSR